MTHDAGTDNIKPSVIFNFIMRRVLRTLRRHEGKQSDGEFDYFYIPEGHVWIGNGEHQNHLIIA